MNASPDPRPRRQPVHTVYVVADRFRADAAAAHGRGALTALAEWAPDGEAFAMALGVGAEVPADVLYERVVEKLEREPVEDLRVDFEDGFGARSEAEEDAAADAVADAMAAGAAAGALPRGIGMRVRSAAGETRERCVRTLERLVARLLERSGGRLPEGFVVTLPKVTAPEEVAFFAALLETLEERHGLAAGSLVFETMVEVPGAVIGPDGVCPLPRWVEAGRRRMTGVHLGVYDYTASLGIAAHLQGPRHSACDFARQVMQVALAGTGIALSDGSTALLPVPGGDREAERRAAVHRGWRRHFDDVSHALAQGFHQGWDLHPAQLPSRYAAVFAFYLAALPAARARLAALRARGSDDPHAEGALRDFLRRGVECGALEGESLA